MTGKPNSCENEFPIDQISSEPNQVALETTHIHLQK